MLTEDNIQKILTDTFSSACFSIGVTVESVERITKLYQQNFLNVFNENASYDKIAEQFSLFLQASDLDDVEKVVIGMLYMTSLSIFDLKEKIKNA